MASGQGYIETQNPALRSLVVGNTPPGRGDSSNMADTSHAKPTERYATFAEVYGPFHEDSMELKEEMAYQRGMMEHIRENMESINKLKALPDPLLSPSYQQQVQNHSPLSPIHSSSRGPNHDSLAEPFYTDRGLPEVSRRTHPDQFHGNIGNVPGAYVDLELTGDFYSPYRPKPTYFELAQNTSRKPPPPPSKSYVEMLKAPKTYSEMRIRDKEEENQPSLEAGYLQKNPSPHKFGISSLPSRWNTETLSPEELWKQRSQGLGKFTNYNTHGNSRSLDLNTPRIPHTLGNSTMPLATVRLPLLGTGQSLPSVHAVDRNQGNTNRGKVSIDINLKVASPRGDDVYAQNKRSSETAFGNSYISVPPLVLNSQTAVPPVQLNSQSSVPLLALPYQPWSPLPNQNSFQVNQQMMDGASGGSNIFPYRQLNNPWFAPQDVLPTVNQHTRKGKYGNYRVFDIHDYKKLQKELRLGSLVGEEKDLETLQDKKEKRAILQEYGRLVRAKNREEMRPRLTL